MWWAWKVIDSQRAGGYSPLDFPLFGRFVLGFLKTERDRGRSGVLQRVEHAAGDGSDRRVKFRETHGAANQGREDVDRKVRTER